MKLCNRTAQYKTKRNYEKPQNKVEAMLIEAARRTRDLKKTSAPFVLWADLADFAINYQINALADVDQVCRGYCLT